MRFLGCGHGIAVGLICERLVRGHVLALDRSEPMVAAATARNRAEIEAGRAVVERGASPEVDLGDRRFDVVFASWVASMVEPAALAAVRRCLASGGRLVLVFEHPSRQRTREAADVAAAACEVAGFMTTHVIREPATAVVARTA